MTFEIAFKHPEHGSDLIGCTYKTLDLALEDVIAIPQNPERFGYSEWLKDATLWVVDENGGICD
jgi:hypothetical protein